MQDKEEQNSLLLDEVFDCLYFLRLFERYVSVFVNCEIRSLNCSGMTFLQCTDGSFCMPEDDDEILLI